MDEIEKRYEELEKRALTYNPGLDRDRLRAAFDFARRKHEGQLRKDGSPFVTHPLDLADVPCIAHATNLNHLQSAIYYLFP